MSQKIINIGSASNDGTGDTLRSGAVKINDNFTELYNTFSLYVSNNKLQLALSPYATTASLNSLIPNQNSHSGKFLTTNGSVLSWTTAASGGASGVSAGISNRLAYYASTGSVVQATSSGLTWNGTNLNITGTVTATGPVSYVRAYFDTLAALQAVSASTWHGMVAHVHEGGGRMYYAHGGAWQPMANSSDLLMFKTIAVAGQTSVEADTATDTLTLVAGTNVSITTNAATDTITINATGGGTAGNLDSLTDVVITGTPAIGQVLKYNGTNWINDTDAVSAGTGGGTVTSVGGTGTVNGLTLTGTVTTTGNLTLGGTLAIAATQVTSGTLLVARGGTGTASPALVAGTNVTISGSWPNQTINATAVAAGNATITWQVTNNSSTDYVFSGPGIVAGITNDPTLYLYRGFTYNFAVTATNHPFAIQNSNGTAYIGGGLTGNGTQNGTVTFIVPMNLTGALRYVCTNHPSTMIGVINIV